MATAFASRIRLDPAFPAVLAWFFVSFASLAALIIFHLLCLWLFMNQGILPYRDAGTEAVLAFLIPVTIMVVAGRVLRVSAGGKTPGTGRVRRLSDCILAYLFLILTVALTLSLTDYPFNLFKETVSRHLFSETASNRLLNGTAVRRFISELIALDRKEVPDILEVFRTYSGIYALFVNLTWQRLRAKR